jgi:GDP-mannose 6-dehydrogenase
MGYVGVVSAACLARLGHEVIGVDVSKYKVDLINDGRSPIVEEGIAELVADAVSRGRVRATTDVAEAIGDTETSFISVGTPSAANGSLSTKFVERVSNDIGTALRGKNRPHTVVYRSTILPGTTENLLVPMLEKSSGREVGDGLRVCFNPEFLREGRSVKDFFGPPMTVIGTNSAEAAATMREVYAGVGAPIVETTFRAAESIKYMSNIYHAVKVSFANEIGALLQRLGVDAREAAEIFCRDNVLNVSPAYLRPGFAFGGSCLPKDLRAFLYLAKSNDVDLPMLSSILPSNRLHIERAYDMVAASGFRRVALFGLSFKSGTDDLRESPLVTLAERLIGKGFDLSIYDANVHEARILGSNREYIDKEIPHFERLMRPTAEGALNDSDVVVIGHVDKCDIPTVLAKAPPRPIIDLQGVKPIETGYQGHYQGICW